MEHLFISDPSAWDENNYHIPPRILLPYLGSLIVIVDLMLVLHYLNFVVNLVCHQVF
jgi:hypothetical protein